MHKGSKGSGRFWSLYAIYVILFLQAQFFTFYVQCKRVPITVAWVGFVVGGAIGAS